MTRLALSLIALIFAAGASPALAQHPGNMNPEEMMRRFKDPAAMQRMQKEAQAAQKCMESINQEELNTLQKRANSASKEIEELCAAGKKAKALKRGLELSREMRSNKTIKKLRECTAKMSETMEAMMPPVSPILKDDSDPTDQDICS